MWQFDQQLWEKEILSSLKKTDLPRFGKKIFGNETINPFAIGSSAEPFQINGRSKFLAVQNYEELVSRGMSEWVHHEDVGFRFRELLDINIDESLRGKTLFLSQPFPFLTSEEQSAKIGQLVQHGHQLNLGWSPLSFGLTRGEILKKPFANWDKIFRSSALESQNVVWFYLSSAPYQWAGAEAHVELGVMLSLAYATIRELEAAGIAPAQALSRFSFGLALGTDILIETSKIAALRILWQRLSEVLGEDMVLTNEIYTLPSLRFFSGRDTQNNLLRITLMALSAALGGAQGFKCIPYDALSRKKSPDALRLSTNIPLILKQEGFVSGVQNMLDGALLFENTTESICEKSWMFFQEIEKKGGLFEAVRSGWLQTELKRQEEFSKNQLCYFQKEIVGVNKYVVSQIADGPMDAAVDVNSVLRLGDIIDPLFLTKSPDDYLTVEPLVVNSVCYDWDVVQIRSDRYRQKTGIGPRVKVVKGGGPVCEKKMLWLAQLFSVAGFNLEVVSGDPSSWPPMAEEKLIILVPSHEEMEESWVPQLRQLSRARLWSFHTAKDLSKIDKFLQTDVNVLEIIKEMQSLVLEGV